MLHALKETLQANAPGVCHIAQAVFEQCGNFALYPEDCFASLLNISYHANSQFQQQIPVVGDEAG